MKAVILVGGFGTRLRPLTCSRPKQLLPLAKKTLIEYMIERLKENSVQEIILAAGATLPQLEEVLGDGARLGVKLHYSREMEPLGTAGAIKNAEPYLHGAREFFALNGDIVSDLNYHQLLNYHRDHKAVATIALYPVEDPTRFGVVDVSSEGCIRTFVEKPERDTAPSNLINAGVYVLDAQVLEHIPPKEKTSIERQIFPKLCSTNSIYGWEHNGFWIDTGTPASYLEANRAVLNARKTTKEDKTSLAQLVKNRVKVKSPIVIGEGTTVHSSSSIGPHVTIGKNVTIGANVRIRNSILFDEAVIYDGVTVDQSVVGKGAIIRKGLQLEDLVLVGDFAIIDDNLQIPKGARICPNSHVMKGKLPSSIFC